MYHEDEFDALFKITFDGDTRSGKSSIISRFIRNEFAISTKQTVAVELFSEIVSIDRKSIKFQFWEIAGLQKYRFKELIPAFYQDATGAVFVYDITQKSTFEALKSLHKEVISSIDENTKYLLLGNKKNLEKDREVSIEDGQKFAEEIGASFFEVSAKDNKNISESLQSFFADIVHARCSCEF